MTRIRLSLLGLYAAAAIVTGGHSAAHWHAIEAARTEECRADLSAPYVCNPFSPRPALIGFVSGAFWPLYWSWEAWS